MNEFEEHMFRRDKKSEPTPEFSILSIQDKDDNYIERYDVIGGNTKIKFTDSESLSEVEKQEAIAWYEGVLKEEFIKGKEKGLDLAQELGPAFQQKIDDLKSVIHEYYKNLGIGSVFIPPVYGDKSESHLGSSHHWYGASYVQVNTHKGITSDREIREISVLSDAIHEMTHSTGLIEVTLTGTNPRFLNEKKEWRSSYTRAGAGIPNIVPGRTDTGSVFEEGSATRMQTLLFENFIKKHYSTTAWEEYKTIVLGGYQRSSDTSLKNDVKRDPNFFIATASISRYEEDGTLEIGKSEYYAVWKLTDMLAKTIPDFDQKLAQSRIFGNDSLIEEAIDTKFGKGIYKKMQAAHWTDVDQFIQR